MSYRSAYVDLPADGLLNSSPDRPRMRSPLSSFGSQEAAALRWSPLLVVQTVITRRPLTALVLLSLVGSVSTLGGKPEGCGEAPPSSGLTLRLPSSTNPKTFGFRDGGQDSALFQLPGRAAGRPSKYSLCLSLPVSRVAAPIVVTRSCRGLVVVSNAARGPQGRGDSVVCGSG